ncbi:YidC/Oxa1 family insertase periplasmic-domain containing protein [Botrimarina hoheduenensis]|uniref:Membrane protein insertase YidC n=1 Tax=Botrimarina hoheduenensis TaxID=2528000 RepID=A0A5C5WED3_9BACT|nr:YidC/Oxa1 family insertase periplasmic-domain containing protein [Botrimarina hoheduenensis]TWT48429.1 Membrane protein insertase YidC [Botrimarina hoheduenensis]
MTPRGPRGDQSQPFDQRFLLFMLLSVSILMMFGGLGAPPPVEPAAQGAAGNVANENSDEFADELAEDADIAKPSAGKTELSATASDPDNAIAAEEGPAAEPQKVGLGSVDPEAPYRMLITLDNVGAGVERVELSSPDYRDLDDRSGYLGRLGAIDAPTKGAQITLVGRGTPAEQAGLQVGDIITSIQVTKKAEEGQATEKNSLTSAAELEAALATTKPGQTVRLGVSRTGAKQRSVEIKLIRQTLDLIRPEAENVRLHSPALAETYRSVGSLLVGLTRVGSLNTDDEEIVEANRRLATETWNVVEADEQSVTFSKQLADLGVTIEKRYVLAQLPAEGVQKATPAYHFDLQVSVRNTGTRAQAIGYELTGPNGLPIEGHWYAYKVGRGFSSYGLRDVVVRYANDKFTQISCASVVKGDVDPMGQGAPLAYVGVDAQYFASIIMPQKPTLTDVRFSEVRAVLPTADPGGDVRDSWKNASFVLSRKPEKLEPGAAALVDDYRIFAGPKLPELLAEYRVNDDPNHAIDGVLYYGWFGWAARPMLGLLHIFHSIFGNYGIAIILLTVVVRGAMFPLSKHQQQSMQKMQLLKPELDRITERYKSDAQKRAAAQQELFRKNNYNPAAGCLPMFIQLPIFIGLYRALAVDVELRQAPLFSDAIRFCSNLAAPDMFYDWSALTPRWWDNGEGMIALGPYLNLLPILSVVLFLVQSKMTMPEPTNDQMRLQQQMMKYMMGFMGLLLFKVASGLALYFIASSLWGLAERKLLPRPALPAGALAAPASAPLDKPVRTGGNKSPRGGRRGKPGDKKRR